MKKGDARPDRKNRLLPEATAPQCLCHVADFREDCPNATLEQIARKQEEKLFLDMDVYA